jgi:hypothetical protein
MLSKVLIDLILDYCSQMEQFERVCAINKQIEQVACLSYQEMWGEWMNMDTEATLPHQYAVHWFRTKFLKPATASSLM